MKTTLLFTTLLLVIATHMYAQDFTATKNVLLDMRSGSSPEVLNALDDYKPVTEREKRLYSRNTDSLRVMIQRYAWEIYQAELNGRKNYNLPDKDALREYVKYADSGFPSILIPKTVVKKLVRDGYDADYYFSLGVSVDLRSLLGGFDSNIKPAVSCDIKVFSPDRDVVKKVDHRYQSETPIRSWDFPGHSFDKLAFDHIMILVRKLKPYVEAAVKEAVAKM